MSHDHVSVVLTSLNLDGNIISAEGARAIAEALGSGKAVLTSLDVGGNNLDEEAALGIVKAARQHDRMTSFGLAGCKIGPTGAKEIADYVQFTAVLTNLNLELNSLGPEGGKAIAEALETNAVLTKIDVRANSLDEAAKQSVRDAVSGREGFELLV